MLKYRPDNCGACMMFAMLDVRVCGLFKDFCMNDVRVCGLVKVFKLQLVGLLAGPGIPGGDSCSRQPSDCD